MFEVFGLRTQPGAKLQAEYGTRRQADCRQERRLLMSCLRQGAALLDKAERWQDHPYSKAADCPPDSTVNQICKQPENLNVIYQCFGTY